MELNWVSNEQVYSHVSQSSLKQKGVSAIPMVWMDTKKRDRLKTSGRSGICVQECKKRVNAAAPLSLEELSPGGSTDLESPNISRK